MTPSEKYMQELKHLPEREKIATYEKMLDCYHKTGLRELTEDEINEWRKRDDIHKWN